MKQNWRLFVAACGLALIAVASACGQHGEPVASLRPDGRSEAATAEPDSAAALARYVKQMKAYVVCLRNHGLPSVADPDAYGGVTVDTSKASRGALARSRLSCQHLEVPMPPEVQALVKGKKLPPPTEAEKEITRKYSACMQANGAPDFPDPGPDGAITQDQEWDQLAPGVAGATATCAPIIGEPVNPGPGVG